MNIIGRLTKDAEVRTTPGTKQVVNFSVAINDSYHDKQGGRMENATYFDCSYWVTPNVGGLLKKGTIVELAGRVSTRAWIGKDGLAHAALNFHTSQIKIHGNSKKERGFFIKQRQSRYQTEKRHATAGRGRRPTFLTTGQHTHTIKPI